MVSTEFEKRKEHLCSMPFTGLTIGPSGLVTLCCQSPDYPLGHISEIPSLVEIYNSPTLESFRTEMEAGRLTEIPNCQSCYKSQQQGAYTTRTYAEKYWGPHLLPNFDRDWQTRKHGGMTPIRYLEYTASNSCNQVCSTCTSFYSSKWEKLESSMSTEETAYFERNKTSLLSISDEDIEKICEILPGLTQITIKGGEPWADRRNLKILNRLLDVNPHCAIYIVSNMSRLSDSAWEVVRRFRDHKGDFIIVASVDGIGKVYEWIRSTPFETTEETLTKFHEMTGIRYSISTTISFHNYFHLSDVANYFKDKPYVNHLSFTNPARVRRYYESRNIPLDVLLSVREKYLHEFQLIKREMNERKLDFNYSVVENETSNPNPPEDLKRCFHWIDKMNSFRGFNLEDHVTDLKHLRERTFN